MNILGIDQIKSNQSELVLKTDPPLTYEVYERFVEIWQVGDFYVRDGSLVWTGAMGIQADFIAQIQINLTEAEEALKQEKTKARNQKNAFLHKIAEQTDLPLI
jgi:hypothetical protein